MRLSARVAGIEFVGDEVRLAVVKTGGKLPVILEAQVARAVYTEPAGRMDALVAATKTAVAALKKRPAMFVLCTSSLYGAVRVLTVPFRGRKRVAAAVPFELEPYLALPIEDMVVDFNAIREVEGKTEVLAVGMRRTHIEEQLAVLNAAGVNPEGITIDVAALTALWYAQRSGKVSKTALNAVLYVREHGAILAIVTGTVLTYFRHLSTTAAQLHAKPAAGAREVQNSLRSFLAGWKSDAAIDTLTVTGLDLIDDERVLFEEGLGVPVQYEQLGRTIKGAAVLPSASASAPAVPADPTAAADLAPAPLAEATHNYWEAVLGSALSASGSGFAFEFRKGELAKRDSARSLVSHAVFSSALALVVLVGYGAYCFVDYRHNRAETERLGQEAWTLFSEAFPASPRLKEGRPPGDEGGIQTDEFFAQEIGALKDSPVSDVIDLFQKPGVLDILNEIGAAMPAGKVLVTEIKLTKGRNPRIEISGEDKDPAAFNAALDKLRQSTLFKVEGEPDRRVREGQSTFKIVAIP